MRVEALAALLEPQLPKGPDVCLSAGPLLGLGDHAVYSTLPERFTQLGYNVYLDQDTQPSNPEIGDLIWGCNPYIVGVSDKKPTVGYSRQGLFYEIANRLPGYRSIEAMERAHGLPPPYSMAPKMIGRGYDGREYYHPKPTRFDLAETVLVDFSAVSSRVGRERVTEALKMMKARFRDPLMMQVMHPSWVVVNQERIIDSAYQCTSIFEYVDMLTECAAWIGSEAGGQSLASAVRGEFDVYDEDARPEIVVTSHRKTFNSRGYTYRNADYRVTASDGDDDYHSPVENLVHKYEITCAVRRIEMSERLAARG